MSDPNSIDDEFLVESTELLEGIARDLLLLDADQKDGRFDPELLNAVFRRMHTLKGIAGMFGFVDLSELAHSLEDLLDQLGGFLLRDLLVEDELLDHLVADGDGGGETRHRFLEDHRDRAAPDNLHVARALQ